MKLCVAYLLLGAFLIFAPLSASAGNLFDPDEMEQTAQPIDEGDTLLPGVTVLRDVAYGSEERQKIDVYMPPHVRSAPIVVMVHGGAWRIGSKDHRRVITNKGKHFLSQGMIFVSVGYRLLPTDIASQAKDIAAALALVQKEAPNWGGDPTRIIAMGHSAGAHLISLVASDPDNPDRAKLLPLRGTVVLDTACYDVPALMTRRHMPLYDKAFGKDPNYWQIFSPYHNLKSQAQPMLLVCSSTRADKACEQAQAFAKKGEEMGVLMGILPQALSHGAVNDELGLPGAYTDAVDSFIQARLK